ncbi:glycerol-3-phosphate dehydrogenase [NAD(+)], cytoplasmic-like [Liolophura sinensis]|uniref:glycerol-3-phosphate dehydrogenase [NAD(+)], cytoplasmic-like n=1 Tax=Liolophura sinensis TaxID=3198878 RepID=UPI003158C6DF
MGGKKVCIVGSGNWGSAIAKIVGQNVLDKGDTFDKTVKMYMYQEMYNDEKLTEIFNREHENVKYLPGVKVPDSVIAVPDLLETVKDADIFIFVVPHQFVRKLCEEMKGHIKKDAIAVSMIKGFEQAEKGIRLISHSISDLLQIECGVLMGANLAPEVASEQFCETTIGTRNTENGKVLKVLFETPYFRCSVVEDQDTVEMCGALKNVVAIGAGIVDGLGCGDNTKAAVLRLGLMEMVKFGEKYFPGSKMTTFFESCGVADLVATCHGGRNRALGEAVVKTGKTIQELEKEILHGQSFQGPLVAREINTMLKESNLEESFPLFTAIHKICARIIDPKEFIPCLRDHPEHL